MRYSSDYFSFSLRKEYLFKPTETGIRRKRKRIQTNVITSLDFILVNKDNIPPASRLIKVMMVKTLPALRLKKRIIKSFKTNLLDINVRTRAFRF